MSFLVDPLRLAVRQRRHSLPIALLTTSLLLSGCGGSSGQDSIVDDTSTADLKTSASGNIGNSLDTTLNGVSRVTSGSDDPADSGVGGLWSNDAQSLVDTSLDLGNDENTVREGSRITIDPNDAEVCAEGLVDMNANDAEFQRCQILVSDMLVRIDATSDTAGTLTYLFQEQPLAVIGYSTSANSFELNLGTLKTLIDAEAALNPDSDTTSPLDTIQGAIRASATATNLTAGAEAGTVALEVSQPIAIASADAGTSLSLGAGTIMALTVDAATETGSMEIALGALQQSETDDDGSVNSIDMQGLTAIIDLTANAEQLSVRNLGIGQGPLMVSLNNSEVLNMGLETFGFTVSMEDETITLDGALDIRILLREVLEDDTVSDTLFSLLEMTAPAGTVLAEQFNGSTMVTSGGPLSYSLTTQDDNGNQVVDQLTVNAGQCAEEVGIEDSDVELVSCF
jgi:hypothetical protein